MPPTSDSVRELVAACLDRLEEGGSAALEELLAQHPLEAERARAHLRLLQGAGLLLPQGDETQEFPERLGPFRLLERLGGGGMGIVYLAEQEPLGRKVALKLVRPDLLYFEGARERFRREVEVVARLEHPGIVPVYTVGEEDGIPFYAMQYVEGRSLEEVLRALAGRDPSQLTARDLLDVVRLEGEAQAALRAQWSSLAGLSWVDACFRLALQIAEVLDHAHRQGVLHRDLKPSNVMLTPDGRALLLDFGLASTRGTNKLTRSGSQVGSLPYMAPEQLRGEALDERTDLYGIGVTLYELLTLRLPYFDAHPDETRRRILEGIPPSMRAANAALSWDAETVCLTAMEREPARRYASAVDFAGDLRAVLERRPIAARRPGPALRLRRFVQRHPARSVAVMLGALVFAGSIAFGLWQQSISRSLRVAIQEKDAALAEARAGFLRSLEATNEMLREVGYYDLLNVPDAQPLRRKLLDRAAAFYDELLVERPADPELRLEAARGFRSQGAILRGLGELALAEQANARALELLQELRAELPADSSVLSELASAYDSLATLMTHVGRLGDAADVERKASEIQAQLVSLLESQGAPATEIREAKLGLAWNKVNLLVTLARAQRFDEAEEAADEALTFNEELVRDDPTSHPARFRLAIALYNTGGLYNTLSRYEEAEAVLGASLALFDELIDEDPALRRNRSHAARAWYNMGSVLSAIGRDEEGIVALERAVELSRGVVREEPTNVTDNTFLLETLARHGVLLCMAGRHAEDAPLFEEGLVLAERMVSEHASLPSARDAHAAVLIGSGWCRMRMERPVEAEVVLRAAFERFDELAQRWPDYLPRANRADAANALARSLRARGRLEEARDVIERSLADTVRVGGSPKTRGLNQLELAEIASAQHDFGAAAEACHALLDSPAEAESFRRAAGLVAGCTGYFASDAARGEPERRALVEACKRGALALLGRALEEGYEHIAELDTAPDLAVLRDGVGLTELLAAERRDPR